MFLKIVKASDPIKPESTTTDKSQVNNLSTRKIVIKTCFQRKNFSVIHISHRSRWDPEEVISGQLDISLLTQKRWWKR